VGLLPLSHAAWQRRLCRGWSHGGSGTAGLLPRSAGARLPGSSAPGQGCSWHIPERVRTSPPAPRCALPHRPRCVLSAWGWRPGPAPLPVATHRPRCSLLQWLPALGAQGVCASCPPPSCPAAPRGLACGSTPSPAMPGSRAVSQAHPSRTLAACADGRPASGLPQGWGTASYQRAPAAAVPGL